MWVAGGDRDFVSGSLRPGYLVGRHKEHRRLFVWEVGLRHTLGSKSEEVGKHILTELILKITLAFLSDSGTR